MPIPITSIPIGLDADLEKLRWRLTRLQYAGTPIVNIFCNYFYT